MNLTLNAQNQIIDLSICVSFGSNDLGHVFDKDRLFLFTPDLAGQSVDQLRNEITRKAFDVIPKVLNFIFD